MRLFDSIAVLGRPVGFARARWGVTDAEGVLALIIQQSLCVPCIVERSEITPARVESILSALGETLGIRWMLWSCAACNQTRDVFRLG